MNNVLKLAAKFAETVVFDENQKFKQQRVMLEQFGHQFRRELISIANEMAGDLLVTKERKMNVGWQKTFVLLYHTLMNLLKEVKIENPYQVAGKLVDWVKNKNKEIHMLDDYIQNYIHNTRADFEETEEVYNARILSIYKLLKLAANTEKFMKDNPKIKIPNLKELMMVNEFFQPEKDNKAGPDELTRQTKK